VVMEAAPAAILLVAEADLKRHPRPLRPIRHRGVAWRRLAFRWAGGRGWRHNERRVCVGCYRHGAPRHVLGPNPCPAQTLGRSRRQTTGRLAPGRRPRGWRRPGGSPACRAGRRMAARRQRGARLSRERQCGRSSTPGSAGAAGSRARPGCGPRQAPRPWTREPWWPASGGAGPRCVRSNAARAREVIDPSSGKCVPMIPSERRLLRRVFKPCGFARRPGKCGNT
jgi:hypothetical protein